MIDTSNVSASVSRTATYVGDIDCGGLVELMNHEKIAPVHQADADGNLLYLDPDGNQTTEWRTWIAEPTENDPGAGRWVNNEHYTVAPKVTFGGTEYDKYRVGGGSFRVPLCDDMGPVTTPSHRTGELSEEFQLGLLKMVIWVRLKYANDKGIAHRKPGSVVAPYVQALETAVAAENGWPDPNAA